MSYIRCCHQARWHFLTSCCQILPRIQWYPKFIQDICQKSYKSCFTTIKYHEYWCFCLYLNNLIQGQYGLCSWLFVDCFLTKFGGTVQWKFPFLPTVCLSSIFGLSSLYFSLSLSLLSSFLFQLSSVLPFVRVSKGWRGRRGWDPDEGDRCVGDRWRKSSYSQLGSWRKTVLYPSQLL